MLRKNIMTKILAHAEAEFPRECCGVVLSVGGKQVYRPIANRAADPLNDFVMDMDEYCDACGEGEVLRIIHSHPGDGTLPIMSDQDRVTCNEIGISFGIVCWPSGEYAEHHPEQMPLTGRPFILGKTDCWGLIMAWHEQQGIKLTDFRVPFEWWTDEHPENLYYDNWEREGFEQVARHSAGCMVIFQVRSNKWNHAGIITEDGKLLHHMFGQLSEVTPYQHGYMRDREVIILRHKDLPQELKPWH